MERTVALQLEILTHAVLSQQYVPATADDALAASRREGEHGAGGERDGATLRMAEDVAEHGASIRRAPGLRP